MVIDQIIMSYGIAKQECRACGNTWNVQWGVVGTHDFGANAPKECPKCGSKDFFNPDVVIRLLDERYRIINAATDLDANK